MGWFIRKTQMSSFASVPGVKRSCLILLLYFPESTAAAKFSWDLVWDGKQTTAHHPCAQPATSWKSLFSIYLTESSCNGILATVGICGGGGGGKLSNLRFPRLYLACREAQGLAPRRPSQHIIRPWSDRGASRAFKEFAPTHLSLVWSFMLG